MPGGQGPRQGYGGAGELVKGIQSLELLLSVNFSLLHQYLHADILTLSCQYGSICRLPS